MVSVSFMTSEERYLVRLLRFSAWRLSGSCGESTGTYLWRSPARSTMVRRYREYLLRTSPSMCSAERMQAEGVACQLDWWNGK